MVISAQQGDVAAPRADDAAALTPQGEAALAVVTGDFSSVAKNTHPACQAGAETHDQRHERTSADRVHPTEKASWPHHPIIKRSWFTATSSSAR